MVLRDKDDSGPWTDASDGVLEQRMFYLNNWRGDVVAMVTSTGYQAEMVRYSPYGTPFGYPGGDCNEDGIANGADRTVIIGWISASTYDVRGDLDLDGDVDSTDSAVFASNYTGTTNGRGVLSAGGNEIGYAGMMWFESGRYLARHRWHDPELGRWGRRDPMGYADSHNLLQITRSSPVTLVDYSGSLSLLPGAGGLTGSPRNTKWKDELDIEPSQCCRDAREKEIEKDPSFDSAKGFVACCGGPGGKAHYETCVFVSEDAGISSTDVGAMIDSCARMHENGHKSKDMAKCNKGDIPHVGLFKDKYQREGKWETRELSMYSLEYSCLEGHKGDCGALKGEGEKEECLKKLCERQNALVSEAEKLGGGILISGPGGTTNAQEQDCDGPSGKE
jgi:RHS repeat-associated protein